MYDRNKGVRSIIEAALNGDPDEECPRGGKFNYITGKITHRGFAQLEYNGWFWITEEYYPIYDKDGNYIEWYHMGHILERGCL
jgi:hypothetical protein